MQVKGHRFQTRYFTLITQVVTPNKKGKRTWRQHPKNENRWKLAFVLSCTDRRNIPGKAPRTVFYSQVCNKFSVSIWTITHSERNPSPAEVSDTLVTALIPPFLLQAATHKKKSITPRSWCLEGKSSGHKEILDVYIVWTITWRKSVLS